MAEEAKAKTEKKEKEDAAPVEEGGQKSRFPPKSILIYGGGFFVLQALLIACGLWAYKSITNPAPVQAAAPTEQGTAAPDELVPMPVLPNEADSKIRAVNARSGQLVYWSIKVSLRVPKSQEKIIRERLAANADLVKQEITTVVAACDPVILEQEADHATLKRQICFALNQILGKSMITEVVIPECLPAPAN